jgi:hypothetical protein
VVRLFGSALALLWVAAWWSWGIQAQALVGRHGLLPLAEFFARAHGGAGPTPLTAPSVFWLVPQDWAILAAVGVGIVCATLAVFDVAPKGALTISALLYISFMAPAAPFLPVLADRLLLESTGLFLLLDRNRPGPAMHWLARGLLFKLYAEMGLGHWLAPGGVWLQGLALGDFLQTTPLPTPLGFYLAHLPEGLLNLATRAGVLVELLVPWLIFGPRRARLLAAVCLTLLQVGVALMGNYGLFAWLAVALHLFLLADADIGRLQGDIHRLSPVVARLFGRLTARLRALRPWGMWAPYVFTLKRRHPVAAPALHHGARGVAAMALGLGYLTASWAALLPAVGAGGPPPAPQAPEGRRWRRGRHRRPSRRPWPRPRRCLGPGT